ncbi:cation:proton antiporter [Sphingomonas sp. R86521]|uniref:cation:proton antiporter n=1 Tax=Sphingomonas sp. R86521 TaxID=3093860 RepID=UPI0036D3341E
MIDLSHESLLLGFGAMILIGAWLPLLLKKLPLSLPIICLGLGALLSLTPWLRTNPEALSHNRLLEQLNEAVVLIALMGAGLRLDRKFGWRRWGSTWRLLLLVMPLTMLPIFAVAHYALGLSVAAALLLAGALAPTDPVLAADVQTGPPASGEDGETRFALTSEAGLNDGLAFPFILLALAIQTHDIDWGHWLLVDFLGDLAIGSAIGIAVGWVAGYLMFRLPSWKLSDTGDGLIGVGVTLFVYGFTTLIHGNGFVAVFVAALTIRSTRPDDEFHGAMAEFSGQIERLLLVIVMLTLGWAIGRGLLASLTWAGALLSAAIILVFRPLATLIGFIGSTAKLPSKHLIGFFGIRGIGTLFYLQYALNRADFAENAHIWAIAGTTVLGSILIHGVSSTPLMAKADALRQKPHH